MSAVTYDVAFPFTRNDDRERVPGEAREGQTASAALREARRMTLTAAGAVAFSRTGDPSIDAFEDAVAFERFGAVPSIEDLLGGS